MTTALTLPGQRIAVTLSEATRITGIKRGRLRSLMAKRVLPFCKVRGLRVILKRALDEVLADDEARAEDLQSRPRCRNCNGARVSRPRGLCWRCFHLPDVRESFEPVSEAGRRGIGNGHAGYKMPGLPTTAVPGSAEKFEVLKQRAEARQCLWHPADAQFEGDPRPWEFLARAAVA